MTGRRLLSQKHGLVVPGSSCSVYMWMARVSSDLPNLNPLALALRSFRPLTTQLFTISITPGRSLGTLDLVSSELPLKASQC